MSHSRFATYEDILSADFQSINKELIQLHNTHQLIDHLELNKQRFSWLDKLSYDIPYYGARAWEFPFAILSSNLQQGMKVADVGCGNTPFTAYLSKAVGPENVTGYDPDYIVDESVDSHSHFGAKKSFIEKLGINFHNEGITKMTAPDNFYDRVFCISVLEHIDDLSVKQEGLLEMARMLKPGGQLILTFDLGISNPLNNIFNIIQCSGLIPGANLDLKFPKKRFVNYGGGSNVDVFGLVLHKSDEKIYTDHSETQEIPMYQAYDRYSKLAGFYALNYNSILAARELGQKLGPLKVFVKSILGKYRN